MEEENEEQYGFVCYSIIVCCLKCNINNICQCIEKSPNKNKSLWSVVKKHILMRVEDES